MDGPADPSTQLVGRLFRLASEANAAWIDFLRDLVTIPSPSRGERLVCERVVREMERLGYDEVEIDAMGNVLGKIGSGPRLIALDAHVDTVGISNPTRWRYDPFRGVISGGTLTKWIPMLTHVM